MSHCPKNSSLLGSLSVKQDILHKSLHALEIQSELSNNNKQQQMSLLIGHLTVFIWCECECISSSWVCVHVWASQWLCEHGYKWENVAYVCSSPQLFTIVFIWGGHTLTWHTNTHPHSLWALTPTQTPDLSFLLRHTSGYSYCHSFAPC